MTANEHEQVDRNKQLFSETSQRMWLKGDFSMFDDAFSPDYIGHVATGDRDREELKRRIAAFRERYPDASITIEDQWGQGDKVVTRMTLRAIDITTGALITQMGINITRFHDGKMVEEWNTWETLRAGG
ncbi:MAG TPA: nuclear transport factor 2 family protein [Ktedonobacterales bacterium]